MSDSTKKRGFAALDPKRLREISSKGGKAAFASGRGHRFSPEQARENGRKGGQTVLARRGRDWFKKMGFRAKEVASLDRQSKAAE